MRWVEGPTLSLLRSIGLRGQRIHLLTAFYSARPLAWLQDEIRADEATVGVRLNPQDASDWFRGIIDPEALLQFVRTLHARGTRVTVFAGEEAHAKLYVGDTGVVIGSANLTMRGLGAGPEIALSLGNEWVGAARRCANRYLDRLRRIQIAELEQFVLSHRAQAHRARRSRAARRQSDEDRLPTVRIQGPGRPAGDYQDFLRWLRGRATPAAREIAARAGGRGQLSGHIHRNFYGLRQFLLANPGQMRRFAGVNPNTYRLSADPGTEAVLSDFVRNCATNEPDFDLNIWRTYLPVECGGRAGRDGGTIGNLKRMLPLVARYLRAR